MEAQTAQEVINDFQVHLQSTYFPDMLQQEVINDSSARSEQVFFIWHKGVLTKRVKRKNYLDN